MFTPAYGLLIVVLLGCPRITTDRHCAPASGHVDSLWCLALNAACPFPDLLFAQQESGGFVRQHWSLPSLGTACGTPDNVPFIC